MAKSEKKAPPNGGEGIDSTASDGGAESVLQTNFTVIERDALSLMQAASMLVNANDDAAVSLALDHNLKLWIAIKTVIQGDANPLPEDVKENLRSLADYVSTTTMEATEGGIESRRLVALARVNMQIAEGLLRGQTKKLIEERAHEIWEAEGRPEGRDLDHWTQAEQEVEALIKLT